MMFRVRHQMLVFWFLSQSRMSTNSISTCACVHIPPTGAYRPGLFDDADAAKKIVAPKIAAPNVPSKGRSTDSTASTPSLRSPPPLGGTAARPPIKHVTSNAREADAGIASAACRKDANPRI